MNQDQRRILGFCFDEWKSLAPLKEEISYSTLYRIAKKLCGRRLLLHRRAKGYRTTRRGIQALQKESTAVRTLEEDKPAEKKRVEEGKKQIVPKKRPVNLAPVQKLLGLSDEKINFFSSLYSPLKKIPSATHEAMVELAWAEICDRAWPVDNFHHLNFLNFGDTFRWKTEEARFCTYMVVKEGEDISSYIIEASLEHGYSAWLRGTSKGEHIFKRKILGKPYVCLEDYQNADRDSKRAVGHLLLGRIKIDWQNQLETISCVAMVNLNPREGKTLFEKSGFNKPQIRRLIPCDLDSIQLPDLEKIGQEAIEAAKNFGPFKIEKPKSDCRPYRKELIDYRNKLLTEEGRSLTDVEGLLNLARGFTGYGFTPSEAVRYTLYKVALPYHTVDWLRSEWVEGFSKKKSARVEINPVAAPELKQKKLRNVQTEVRIATEFSPKYRKLMGLVKARIDELQRFQEDENWRFLLSEEKEKFRITLDAFKVINEHLSKVRKGDWVTLADFENLVPQIMQEHFSPLLKIAEKAKARAKAQEALCKIARANNLSELQDAIREVVDESSLEEEQVTELIKSFKEKRSVILAQRKKDLISYLQKEKSPNEDITSDLLNLGLVERVTVGSVQQLQGIDKKYYLLDAFNFPKHRADWVMLDHYKSRVLSLLTDKKHTSFLNFLQQFAQLKRPSQEKKALAGSEIVSQGQIETEAVNIKQDQTPSPTNPLNLSCSNCRYSPIEIWTDGFTRCPRCSTFGFKPTTHSGEKSGPVV